MSEYQQQDATSVDEDNSIGTYSWFAAGPPSGGLYHQSGTTHYLINGDFEFDIIPSGSTIVGLYILYTYDASATSGPGDLVVNQCRVVLNGVIQSPEFGAGTDFLDNGYLLFGSDSDINGLTLTPAHFNNREISLALSATSTSDSEVVMYGATLFVYYDLGGIPICVCVDHHHRKLRSSSVFPLRQSTNSQKIPLGPFLSNTDGITRQTGLTIDDTDIKLEKFNAGSLVSKNSGGATELATGNYYGTFDATDTDTIGPLKVLVQLTGSVDVWVDCMVWSEAMYDFLFGATAPSSSSANDNATALLDLSNGVESGLTMRQSMRLAVAALAGKSSGGGTSTVTYRNVADTKDVIVATVDSYGNRSALTRDVS